MTNILIIGDSHCLTFNKVKGVSTFWMGALTAYNLEKHYDLVKDKMAGRGTDYWFCFGEIDCRIHVEMQVSKTGKHASDIIEDIVVRYVKFIESLPENRMKYIMAVPPQGDQHNFYNLDVYVSRARRQQITDVFNLYLEEACLINKIPFIDIWALGWNQLDENIFEWPIEDFAEDKCHIKNEIAARYLEGYLAKNN